MSIISNPCICTTQVSGSALLIRGTEWSRKTGPRSGEAILPLEIVLRLNFDINGKDDLRHLRTIPLD